MDDRAVPFQQHEPSVRVCLRLFINLFVSRPAVISGSSAKRVSARFIPGFPCRAPPRHTLLHRNSGGLVRDAKGVRSLVKMTCTFFPAVTAPFLCKQVPCPPTTNPWDRHAFPGEWRTPVCRMNLKKRCDNARFPDEPYFVAVLTFRRVSPIIIPTGRYAV